jgi:glycogen operon protein
LRIITWFDWDLDEPRKRPRDFIGRLIHLRLEHLNLHRRKFFQDREIRQEGQSQAMKDIAWFNPDGSEVSYAVWHAVRSRSIALMLNGRTLEITHEHGAEIIDDSFLILVNASPEGVKITLPASPSGNKWRQVIDTSNIENPLARTEFHGRIIMGGRSLCVLSDRLREES